ncbi:MAG: hypothetical protein D3906_00550 [Candidatus Electrothrix sp. AUS1_2]|nr:hypothetical protein [Candidatus Electrothrix sp. AUS1_2]
MLYLSFLPLALLFLGGMPLFGQSPGFCVFIVNFYKDIRWILHLYLLALLFFLISLFPALLYMQFLGVSPRLFSFLRNNDFFCLHTAQYIRDLFCVVCLRGALRFFLGAA